MVKKVINKAFQAIRCWQPGKTAGGAVFLGAVFSLAAQADSSNPGFDITRVETKLIDKVYHLSVQIDYQFSQEVLEAIESGVPMVVALDIELLKPRNYMWDVTVAELKQRFQLQYHALAEQYIVRNLNSGAQNTAPTFNTALFYLKEIKDLPLIDQQLLDMNQSYRARVRVSLEFDSLPVPLKLSAYTSRSWWLGSDWFEWELYADMSGVASNE